MKVYVVLVDGCLSDEAYLNCYDAKLFIEGRADKPIIDTSTGSLWRYKSERHIYLIKEINIKGDRNNEKC